MSIKKRVKAGRIEPGSDGASIVVHFTTEITHFDEDGMPGGVEKIPDKKEVAVGKYLRKARAEDLPDIAQEITDKCRYIPPSKVRQVEQALAKMLAMHLPQPSASSSPAPASTPPRSRPRRAVRGDRSCAGSCTPPHGIARPADVLPEALLHNVDEYADELYEETMEAKAGGAQRLLRLCTEVHPLEDISEHSTLLGVLSRELRENAKRSNELAVAITGIFLCLAHFSQFHGALGRHQCGEATMRVVEYEGKRVKALQKELKLAHGRLVARGSQATAEERAGLEREEQRYKGFVVRQDRLLQLCVLTLRDLAEDTAVERKLVGQRICHFLIPLLSRSSEELLLGVLGFLHKLSAFEQNKDQVLQSSEALCRLAELVGHPSPDVALLALRLCFNLSFDVRGRKALATQTSLVPKLLAAFQQQSLRAVTLKLLYQLSLDMPQRALIAQRHSSCVLLALQLVVRGKERQQERDAVALCVNLAAEETCAVILAEAELFPRLVLRAIQGGEPLLLKIVRHVMSHRAARPRLLAVMQEAPGGGASWLHDLTHLACRSSERPDLLVEILGTLSAMDCQSPEVPWPELCDIGLIELLHRLLMVGFSDDDVLLECIILASILALDEECAPLMAASKVPGVLPMLLTEKQEDADIVVQLLHALRCLLLQEETCEVVLQETDAPDRILELLQEGVAQGTDLRAQSVQAAASDVLDLVVALGSQGRGTDRWCARIKAVRFELHNREWLQQLRRGDQQPMERKAPVEARSCMRWTDVGGLADRCWGNNLSGIALR